MRGQLARLLAVLVALAGLAFAVGLQCTEGMAMPMAHGMGAAETFIACDSAVSPASLDPGHRASAGTQVSIPLSTPRAVQMVTAGDGGSSDHQGLGGTLATCLAFLFAVVAAVATLPRARLRGLVTTSRRVRVVLSRAVWSRTPRLEELCLLRT